MGGKTNYLENAVLNLVLGRVAWTPPATVYVALYTTSPGEDGTGVEVQGGNYARVAVPNDTTNWPVTANGMKSNAADIVFPVATGNWGDVVAWALCDAPTGGNVLVYGEVSPPRPVYSGDVPRFVAGTLIYRED